MKELAKAIDGNTSKVGDVAVRLSNELVHLLSDQLYQSPSKAIEELVVNSYDASATICRVFAPTPSSQDSQFIAVYDDGDGMDLQGLVNLWTVGVSNKKSRVGKNDRKQIGKFGIGKLSTYTLANRVSYVTAFGGKVLSVTVDYHDFATGAHGSTTPVILEVKEIYDLVALADESTLGEALSRLALDPATLASQSGEGWTLVVLEELKEKTKSLKTGHLRRVLSTAMPLEQSFRLYLNGTEIESSKLSNEVVVSFEIHEIPQHRLDSIKTATGQDFKRQGNRLVSQMFKEGVSGKAIVTLETLVGKSDDLMRSNGFFVRVRNRLINEVDALFGIHIPSFQTFNRFRADVNADDLDEAITASREGIEDGDLKRTFQQLLVESYLEARVRYDKAKDELAKKNTHKPESERNFVNPRLVEQPVADVLATGGANGGVEPDGSWFYTKVSDSTHLSDVIKNLYLAESGGRKRYSYAYTDTGSAARMVTFDPATSSFVLNISHAFVRAHFDDGRSKALLEDVATAEALLEIYLRESGVAPRTIGEVLERRDALLRSLADDHPYSLQLVSQALRDSAGNERDLEINFVSAARALGFNAVQVSNGDNPDGIARLSGFPNAESVITLEAKSSKDVPSLGAIDFAGLRQHVVDSAAHGCWLVAPGYPGSTKDDDAAAAKRAADLKISCWTVDQVARVVGDAETRHVNAKDVLQIVLTRFTPSDVTKAVNDLLSTPDWLRRDLYIEVLNALRSLEGRLLDRPRTIDLVAAEISRKAEFANITAEDVEMAVRDIAGTSQKGLVLSDGKLNLTVSIDELQRRTRGLTGNSGKSLVEGSFRQSNN
ncbi:MAG: ATP-binding protein [Thermomonas sp.]